MPALPIMCMVCSEDVSEADYPAHMQKHGGMGKQLSAIAAQKNVPKESNLPPGITPADMPNEEFLKTVAEMEKGPQAGNSLHTVAEPLAPLKPKPQDSTNKVSPPSDTPVAERKPLQLVYKYEGEDEKGHPVGTLELDVKGSHMVVAYCTICKKQVSSREVQDLSREVEEFPAMAQVLREAGYMGKENLAEETISEKAKEKIMFLIKQEKDLKKQSGLICEKCEKPFKNPKALSMHKMRTKHE